MVVAAPAGSAVTSWQAGTRTRGALPRRQPQAGSERGVAAPVLLAPPGAVVRPVANAVDNAALAPRLAPAWQQRLVRTIVVTDFLAALVAAVVAVLLRFGTHPQTWYLLSAAAFPLAWVLANSLTRSYEPRFLGTGSEEFRRVSDAAVRLFAATAVASLAFKLELARLYVLFAFPLAVLLCLTGRYALRQRLHRQRARGQSLYRVLVVGRERSVAELVRQLGREAFAGFSVVGACVDRPQGPLIEGVRVVGSSTTIVAALHQTEADTVAVGAWSDLTQADLRRLSWELEGSGVSLVVAPSLTDIAGPRIHIRPVSGLPLLHIEEPEFTGSRRLLKSVVDRSIAVVALILLSPLLAVLVLLVRLDSHGSAVFRQIRVGVDGQDFTIYKFRSMYQDAEHRLHTLTEANEYTDGPLFKVRADPRITRMGGWLRRFSVDELPQLLNVVKGEMSLVGPRPPLPQEVSQYGKDVRRRLLVKPGLTGLWQISGRSELSWDESVRLDLHYVESWSLALDLMILWKTFAAVVRRQGAY